MKCKEYYNVRSEFKDGDMPLYRGSGFLAKSIQYFDKAYYNHIGVIKWINGRLFTVEMWTEGIIFIPLSRRMKTYDDFCIARVKNKSQEEFLKAIDGLLEQVERDTNYDYFLLPRIAFYKKTNIDLVGMGKRNRFICSELAQSFTDSLNVKCYENVDLITPQDFLRYKDDNEVEILYDLSPKI